VTVKHGGKNHTGLYGMAKSFTTVFKNYAEHQSR